MHSDRERPAGPAHDDDDDRDGVMAADDTGLVSQQAILTQSELDESLPDDAEAGGP